MPFLQERVELSSPSSKLPWNSASVLVYLPWPQHPEPGHWLTLSRTPRLQHLVQLMVLTLGTFQADVHWQAGWGMLPAPLCMPWGQEGAWCQQGVW